MPQNTKSLLFLLLQYELINVFTNFYGFVTYTIRLTKNDVKLENGKKLIQGETHVEHIFTFDIRYMWSLYFSFAKQHEISISNSTHATSP